MLHTLYVWPKNKIKWSSLHPSSEAKAIVSIWKGQDSYYGWNRYHQNYPTKSLNRYITTSPRGIWVFSTQNCFNILSKLSSLTMKLVDVKGNRQTWPIQRGKSIRKKQPVRGLRYHLPKAILKRGIINIFEEPKDLMLKEVNEGVITINY